MHDGAYSEDYARLLRYKQDMSADATENEAWFFFQKYKTLIDTHCWRYIRRRLRNLHATAALDVSDWEHFTPDAAWLDAEREEFYRAVQEIYLPQALKSFSPQKVTNKASYAFATYLHFYLQHAKRDLVTRRAKQQLLAQHKTADVESAVIDRLVSAELAEKIAAVKKRLTPLQQQLFDALAAGKRQADIALINPKTGKRYSKGYISKAVQKIRAALTAIAP